MRQDNQGAIPFKSLGARFTGAREQLTDICSVAKSAQTRNSSSLAGTKNLIPPRNWMLVKGGLRCDNAKGKDSNKKIWLMYYDSTLLKEVQGWATREELNLRM